MNEASDGHDAASYGRHVSAQYDAIYEGVLDTAGAVDCLADLAGGGRLLEFGVGTGRVALALVAKGVTVTGIDGSQEMLEILAAKPGGDLVSAACGDFSTISVPGSYDVVALLFNTVYALPDQEAQIRCFANAAAHLAPGGRFVVEAWVPDPPAPRTPRVRPRRLAEGFAGLVIEEHEPAKQILRTIQLVLSEAGQTTMFPVVHRYAWPSELDLMGRLAGLTLEYRWADWQRSPFGNDSGNHISVWKATSRSPGIK